MTKYTFSVPFDVSVSWPHGAIDGENLRKMAEFMRDEVQKRLSRPEYHGRLQTIVEEAAKDVEAQCVVDVEREDVYVSQLLGGRGD